MAHAWMDGWMDGWDGWDGSLVWLFQGRGGDEKEKEKKKRDPERNC